MIQRKNKAKSKNHKNLSNRHSNRRSNRKKTGNNKQYNQHRQSGGDTGRYSFPPAYFGNGTTGYGSVKGFSSNSKQLAVSDGTIHTNGQFAGPNLFPQQAGSGCGCNKLQSMSYNNSSRSSRSSRSSHKNQKRRKTRRNK